MRVFFYIPWKHQKTLNVPANCSFEFLKAGVMIIYLFFSKDAEVAEELSLPRNHNDMFGSYKESNEDV